MREIPKPVRFHPIPANPRPARLEYESDRLGPMPMRAGGVQRGMLYVAAPSLDTWNVPGVVPSIWPWRPISDALRMVVGFGCTKIEDPLTVAIGPSGPWVTEQTGVAPVAVTVFVPSVQVSGPSVGPTAKAAWCVPDAKLIGCPWPAGPGEKAFSSAPVVEEMNAITVVEPLFMYPKTAVNGGGG